MVWSDLHARVHIQLKRHGLLPRSRRILLAVSGGQDSVCMAQMCLDLADRWDWTLAIGHCDHGWRSDSAENTCFVRDLARQWNLPFYERVAVDSLASEASARTWRYQQLVDIARECGATQIATGHTASDRAETLLHHLLRGAGTDGLSAIARERDLIEFCPQFCPPGLDVSEPALFPKLVRPLFDVFRPETAAFCRDRQLPIWEDSTNRDERYTRNRIRHRLLPLLAEQFNPRVEAALVRTTEMLASDRDCLEALAAEHAREIRDRDNPNRLYRPALQRIHRAIQRRLLRDWLHEQCGVDLRFDRVEKVCASIDAPQKTRTDPIVGTRVVEVCGDWLVLSELPR